jgi:hypothetical protein
VFLSLNQRPITCEIAASYLIIFSTIPSFVCPLNVLYRLNSDTILSLDTMAFGTTGSAFYGLTEACSFIAGKACVYRDIMWQFRISGQRQKKRTVLQTCRSRALAKSPFRGLLEALSLTLKLFT